MKTFLTLGMVAALIISACAVHAVPTMLGPSGLFLAPSGDVTCPGEVDFAASYLGKTTSSRMLGTNAVGSAIVSDDGKDSFPLRVLYGVGGNFEVGAAVDPDGFYGSTFWNINAKYKLPWTCANSALALGALYGEANANEEVQNAVGVIPAFTTEGRNLDATEVYLSGTHGFCFGSMPTALTLDINWTELKFVNTSSEFRVQFGADMLIAKGLDLMGDVETKAKSNVDTDMLWSAGLRYLFCPSFTVEAGAANGILIGGPKTAVFVGINYAYTCLGR